VSFNPDETCLNLVETRRSAVPASGTFCGRREGALLDIRERAGPSGPNKMSLRPMR
jgi:hypothetical protein